MTERLLLVLPDVPYPPNRNGLALRYYPLIKELAKSLQIHLICRTPHSEYDLGDLLDYVVSVEVVQEHPESAGLREKLRALFSRISPASTPHLHIRYGSPVVAETVCAHATRHYDCVLWAGIGQVLDHCIERISADRWVLDMVDSPSLHYLRRPERNRLLKRLKLRKMQRWEYTSINKVDAACYTSPVDCQQVADKVNSSVELYVVPNGTYIEEFGDRVEKLPNPSLGFLGNMAYPPNIEAVHRLHRIFERAKGKIPGLHLCVIGRNPASEIQSYASDDVTITGSVESIWPWVRGVDLFVLPMEMGAGQQNKLLEIMYAGRPVIATTVANGGIGAVHEESIVIADGENKCVDAVIALLADPDRRKRIGEAGRRLVMDRYSWKSRAEKCLSILRGTARNEEERLAPRATE